MTVESPCIRTCTLDAEGRLCLGCFRTLDEIMAWTQLSEAERAGVIARLSARRSAHAANPRGPAAGVP